MTKLSAWKMAGAVFTLSAATAITSPAQIFTSLVNFDFANGADPMHVTLVQGHNGNLFGTTEAGGHGDGSLGTVFEISPGSKLTTLYNFGSDSGALPQAGLLLGTDGNFYGTTYGGGMGNCIGGGSACGTVFKVTPSGGLTTLHDFCAQEGQCGDGQYPYASLIQATDGNFYGTTNEGGGTGEGGFGTVFRITSGGVLATIHSFHGSDGSNPLSPVIQGSNGYLYGTTPIGGDRTCPGNNGEGCGVVFTIGPKGQFTALHIFEFTDGAGPQALIQASDGNFYGVTAAGGDDTNCDNGCGTVFKMSPDGKIITLHTFNSTDGANPQGTLLQATDGNLYGTTIQGGNPVCNSGYQGCGTIFRIMPNGAFATVHNFDGTDGSTPIGGLAQATNGILYGTTEAMGAGNWGTLFSLDVGLDPFVTFVRFAGRVGQTGPILGQGFTGTTSVAINGIPGVFTVISDTFIKATVPEGATTGYVTVTTPSGTLTSNVPFRVIP